MIHQSSNRGLPPPQPGRLKRSLKAAVIILYLFYILFNIYSTFVERDPSNSFTTAPIISFHGDGETTANRKPFSKFETKASPEDLHRLLNITDFVFLSNPTDADCFKHGQYFLVIFVHSGTRNRRKRHIIRRTWASRQTYAGHRIKLVFMLGEDDDPLVTEQIRDEINAYHDVVQGNFRDTYRNMTYKHVMALKWVARFCPAVPYVLKVDDDVFVDLYQLIDYLEGMFGSAPSRLMACFLNPHSRVSRSYRNKWRVSFKEYPDHYFPRYCAGWSIIMSGDVVRALYAVSGRRPYFWIDDVYVSGILANDLNITHYDIGKNVYRDESSSSFSWKPENLNDVPPMFRLYEHHVDQISPLWNHTVQYYQMTVTTSNQTNVTFPPK